MRISAVVKDVANCSSELSRPPRGGAAAARATSPAAWLMMDMSALLEVVIVHHCAAGMRERLAVTLATF